MIDWPATIAAIATPLSGVGVAARFIWNKVERRFAELDRKLAKCEQRDRHAQELQRIAPKSVALKRAKPVLDDLKLKTAAAKEEVS